MSNITVKNDNNNALARPTSFDPFRMARELLRWDPFREMASLPNLVEQSFAPAFEVKETKDAYVFKADLPGIAEQDIEVTRTGNRLSISGKREQDKEDKQDTYYAYERTYGSFTRSFTLPDGIDGDHITADLRNGVLTLAVPKVPAAQPKKIAIGSTAKKQ